MVNDLEAPDANEEYLLYQTLLGTWPMQANGEPEPVPSADYIERIQAYMAKALKEAKINTSWIQPNEEWDVAKQIPADFHSCGERNYSARSDQFGYANLAQADLARCAGYLPGN
jgi:maltooligosyltrehalose synthase